MLSDISQERKENITRYYSYGVKNISLWLPETGKKKRGKEIEKVELQVLGYSQIGVKSLRILLPGKVKTEKVNLNISL